MIEAPAACFAALRRSSRSVFTPVEYNRFYETHPENHVVRSGIPRGVNAVVLYTQADVACFLTRADQADDAAIERGGTLLSRVEL